MDIEIVAIGDEVLSGYTLNGNAAFISRALFEAGLQVTKHHVVGDEEKAIHDVLIQALSKGASVVITGGLGPTCDDHTRSSVCKIFATELEYHETLFEENTKRFGSICEPQNQAMQPKGAFLLKNSLGTASGFILQNEKLFPGAYLFAMPGVPSEMRAMLPEGIAFLKKLQTTTKRRYVAPLHFMKLKEVEVDPQLRTLIKEYPNIEFGIYPAYGTLTVHLKAYAESEEEFLKCIQKARESIISRFEEYLYTSPSGRLEEALHLLLREKKLALATAESCTGGALAHCFTSQSGASSYFQGGVIAYANQVKEEVLQVKKETLEKHGAVSVEVTQEMALQVAEKMHAECAISVSGILGPEGGTNEKPVGTVAASIFLKGRPIHSWVMHHQGTRLVILEKTIQEILGELLMRLNSYFATQERKS